MDCKDLSVSQLDCRMGEPKCGLGTYGCKNVQVSGNSALNVLKSRQMGRKTCADLPALGPGQYDLIVIGDAAATEDDILDIVFQDPASELILTFMEKVGIDLSRTYMTKLIRCKSSITRAPTVQEINACRGYLKQEIELIQPKAVVTIGAKTLRAFNLHGQGSINAIRGKVFTAKLGGWEDSPEFKVIPTLNPGSFFYKPSDKLRARVQQDFLTAKQVIEGEAPTGHFTPTNWNLIDSEEKLDWLVEQLENVTLFGWDTESAHLGIRKAPLLCFSFAWGWEPDQSAVLPILKHDPNAPSDQTYHTIPGFGELNNKRVTAALKRVFENPNIAKSAHNFKYDYNVLRWNYGICVQGFLFDTVIMKHLMDENPPSNLEFCCDLEFAWGDYSATKREITGQGKKLKNTYDKVPDDLLWPYAAVDALGTYRLCCLYAERLKEKPNLWTFYQEESEPLIRALVKAEYKGCHISTEVMDLLKVEYEQEQNALLISMRRDAWPDFNPASHPQVIKALKNLGVDQTVLFNEKTKAYSSDKNTLNQIIEQAEGQDALNKPAVKMARNIQVYRNRNKLISTYLVNASQDIDNDGRLRYSWMQAGPVSGRLSNRWYHQLPKIDEAKVTQEGKFIKAKDRPDKLVMRDLCVADKDYSYVYGDYSQIELHIIAILSDDAEMLRILNGGGDLHTATAYEFLKPLWPGLTEKAVSKFNRTEVGKRINFGLAYGSEGHALVKTGKWLDKDGIERNFTWKMITDGMERWKSRFKGVSKFIDVIPDIVSSYGGTATNVFGRERHFGPLLNHPKLAEREAAERECVNFFVQSVAGSLTNRTIVEVDKLLTQYQLGENVVCLVNTVHDSITYEVHKDYVPWFKEALTAVSLRTIPELKSNQFKMDVGVGESWSEAEMAT